MSEPALARGVGAPESQSARSDAHPERPAVRAILAAASTGGPEALIGFLSPLIGSGIRVPIFVVQHLLAEFTPLLAGKLSEALSCRCVEPVDGQAVCTGTVFLAPGDHHMRLARDRASVVRICLDRGAPVNYCRPAADPLFVSAAQVYGSRVLVAVLTGMGSDGLDGVRLIADRGGLVCAQDEASSAVWGMPGSVCRAGLASYTGSPRQLGVWSGKFAARRLSEKGN